MITLNVSALNTTSPIVTVPRAVRRDAPQRVAQIVTTGTIRVTIEGRLDAAASWREILSETGGTAQLIALMPEMRVTATNAAEGAQATVYIGAEDA